MAKQPSRGMTTQTQANTEVGNIKKRSALPLYQQIKSDVRNKIDSNQWLPGQQLPSENVLVEKLGVSRMTIHRALRELTNEGLLNRVHGIGTFVATPPRHASLIRLQNIAEEVQQSGSEYRCSVLKQKYVQVKTTDAIEMGVSEGTLLCHLKVVHFQDDVAIQLEDRLIHPDYIPEFDSTDFTLRTATDYLVSLFKPDEMEHIVRAVVPGKRTARVLAIEPNDPCIELTRRTWKDNRVVTRVVLTYPGSRYDLRERYLTEEFSKK